MSKSAINPIETGKRLEMLRGFSGYKTLKEFVAILQPDEEGRRVSYEAAQNYHNGVRDLPVRYMDQLLRTFEGLSADWLIGSTPIDMGMFGGARRTVRPARVCAGTGK
jgi:hypothetical protein